MRRADCTVFLSGAAILWLVALAVALATMASCAPLPKYQPLPMYLDGYQRELMACDADAETSTDPSEAYDACLAIHGIGTDTTTTNEGR